MSRSALTFTLMCLLPLISCQRSTDLTEAQRRAVIQGVQQMAVQFFDDVRTHNADAIIAHMDSSDAFFWVFPPDTTLHSRATLAAGLRTDLDAYPSIEGRWLRMRVEPLTATIAVYTGVFEQVGTTLEGEIFTTRGIESATVILRDDGWKFLSGQTTLRSGGTE